MDTCVQREMCVPEMLAPGSAVGIYFSKGSYSCVYMCLCVCAHTHTHTHPSSSRVLFLSGVLSPTPPGLEALLRWYLTFHVTGSGSRALCMRGHECCHCLSSQLVSSITFLGILPCHSHPCTSVGLQ